ncbi:uncharacterized protein PV07_06993 [Cladophialophora immunda]|uniref:Uncharacterized protein n=1 Tax=Cladophialophora immunda TaxID=569365 RepID=A0A0D2C9X7_9EURO|nr:uncharacterized protein PV07_06993 [Cladophialophora immunda]KIW27235.1 hypothetical protein PV07_06993 [Cladophialophora immunda]OQV02027.1 hypothetical protein CLAIMM_07284 [Cladophialophora immunda]
MMMIMTTRRIMRTPTPKKRTILRGTIWFENPGKTGGGRRVVTVSGGICRRESENLYRICLVNHQGSFVRNGDEDRLEATVVWNRQGVRVMGLTPVKSNNTAARD